MILDTSFLIDVMDGEETAIEKVKELESDGVTQRIPAIVLYELYVGVGYADDAFTEVRKLRTVLDSRPTEPLDAQTSALAGRIDGTLRRRGVDASAPDVIIGATARQLGEPVVTGDASDFEKIPEVDVETY